MVWWSLPSLTRHNLLLRGARESPWAVVGVDRSDEVTGNDPGALVDRH